MMNLITVTWTWVTEPLSLRSRETIAAFLFLILSATAAAAQGTILQGGPWAPGHAPMYTGQGSGQAVVQDSGPAGGGATGYGLSEQRLVARGTGTPPYAGPGTGPFGTNWCDYDAPITNPTGYHFLCFSPNASGGGLIAYGAGGAAAQLPLSFNFNGTVYQFPFVIGGVVGPVSSTVNDFACWNNTVGTLLKDCKLTVGVAPIGSGTSNGVLYDNGGVLGNTAQGPAISVLTANAGAPVFSSTPTIAGLTITPTASSFNLAFNTLQSITGSSAGNVPYNQIIFSSDNAAITPSGGLSNGIGLQINMNVGGSSLQGNRTAFVATVNLNGASSTAAQRYYSGAQFGAFATTGDGGTNLTSGAQGTLQALGTIMATVSGATNLYAVNGFENDANVVSGSSTKLKLGFICGQNPADAVQGADKANGGDACFSFTSQAGAGTYWTDLIAISAESGQTPVGANSCIICSFVPTTITTGIDFSSMTISGNFLKGPGANFTVSGSGAIVSTNNTAAQTGPSGALILTAGGAYIAANLLVGGVPSALSGATFAVHLNTNENLAVYGNVNSGIEIGSINDASSGTSPLTLVGSVVYITTLANTATTSAVCYNTSSGLLTYDGTIGTCNTSSMRFKHEIKPLAEAAMLDGVLRMQPVSFYYNPDQHTDGQQLGLVAEDLAEIDPRLVGYDNEGKPNSIRFLGPMFSYVVGAIKELKAENDNLRAELKATAAAR